MVVCQYFLRGQCKFGDRCKNEHPGTTGTQRINNQTWSNQTVQMPFSTETMAKDFTPGVDKPLWPLSTYGPSKLEPCLLTGLDESPEELRVRAVAAIKSGVISDYLKYESDKITAAEQVYGNTRTNIQQAFDQASRSFASGGNSSVGTGLSANGSVFGPASTSAFGQPSAFGVPENTASAPSAFGSGTTGTTTVFGQSTSSQPTFGQSSMAQAAGSGSAFGQSAQSTSAFPQPTSAFGQASQPSSLIRPATGAFGSTGQSTFGTTGTSGSGSTGRGFASFAGQPSAFGLGAASAPNLPSATTGGSVFGQPSLSNPSSQTSVFGAPAQGTSAFGSPSTFGTQTQAPTSAFASNPSVSAFGSGGSSSSTSGSVFGPGGSGSAPAPTSGGAFGGTTTSAFSTNTQSTPPFGAPTLNPPSSVFTAQQPTSAFGSQPPPPQASVFGTSTSQPQSQPTSAFGVSSVTQQQPTSAFSLSPHTQTGSGTTPKSTFYDQFLPENYAELLPKVAIEAFKADRFEWGHVPEFVPPKEFR